MASCLTMKPQFMSVFDNTSWYLSFKKGLRLLGMWQEAISQNEIVIRSKNKK